MEWELSKENLRPSESGVNVDVLKGAMKAKTDGSARFSIFEHQRRQFLQAILSYDGDDPLVPWIRYIKWLNDAFPGAQAEVVTVLEICTGTFQKQERYRRDVRYLRLWIQYADCCPDSSDVFAFLEINEIGQDFALFYEAYATSMEVRRNFSKADDLYQLGLQRSAQPLGRLQSMYKTFRVRMTKRGQRKLREEQQLVEDGTVDNFEMNAQFRSLGTSALLAGEAMEKEGFRKRFSRPLSPHHLYPLASRTENAKLSAFVHPGFGGLSKIGKRGEGQRGPGPDFKIFVDGELTEDPPETRQTQFSKPTIPTPGLEDMRNTKRHSHRVKGAFHDLPQPLFPSTIPGSFHNRSASSGCSSTLDVAAMSCEAKVCFGYDTSLMGEHGRERERSFEEHRLLIWNESRQTCHTDGQEDQKVAIETNEDASGAVVSSTTGQFHSTGMEGDTFSCKRIIHLKKIGGQGSDELVAASAEARVVMTQWHNQPETYTPPSSSFQELAIVHESVSNLLELQGDETVSFKQFAEEGIAFALEDPKLTSIDTVCHHGLIEPTINTKLALADILGMFNEPLEYDAERKNSKASQHQRNQLRNPIGKASGFEIFVDNNQRNAAKSITGEQRTKGSLRRSSAASVAHTGTVSAFVDDDGRVKGPNMDRAVKAVTSKQALDFTAESGGAAVIYHEEKLDVQRQDPVGKKSNLLSVTKTSVLPMDQAGGFEVFQDDHYQLPLRANKVETMGKSCVDTVLSLISETNTCQSSGECDSVVQSKESVVSAKNVSFCQEVHEDDLWKLSLGSDHENNMSVQGQSWEHLALSTDVSMTRRVLQTNQSGDLDTVVGGGYLSEAFLEEVEQNPERNSPTITVGDKRNSVASKRPLSCDTHELAKVTSEGTNMSSKEEEENTEKLFMLDPWDEINLQELLMRLKSQLSDYQGFYENSNTYSGSIPSSSLRLSNVRDRILQLGSSSYRLKQCIGQGAFAQIFKIEDQGDDLLDDTPQLALKFQKPPCLWEFYIYRQLDMRISPLDRHYFGRARKFHHFPDCSFMICDYGQHGTLQDVVNAYLAISQRMDEVLCMFYTIEMLHMLEALHRVGIIHGDFKPDNLLIRDDSDDLEEWTAGSNGCWKSQGLQLIDWGRSIDCSLYPEDTKFKGDCKTDFFRCTEMLEGRPWTFQADTFGLCGVVHCLLYGKYMQVEKVQTAATRFLYQPKSTYKRYWNSRLWKEFFETMLNVEDTGDILRSFSSLQSAFEGHLTDLSLGKKVKDLLKKQTIMMFTCG